MQSWAHLEEQQGAYQRAQELRSYSLQEHTSFVPPLRLGPDAAVDPIFAPIFGQVATLFLSTFCSVYFHHSAVCTSTILQYGLPPFCSVQFLLSAFCLYNISFVSRSMVIRAHADVPYCVWRVQFVVCAAAAVCFTASSMCSNEVVGDDT